MWTKRMALGATALAVVAMSACGSTEEEISLEAETGTAEQASDGFCGGIAGFHCPDGYICVDDPADSCDPQHGGADCGGVCVKEEPPSCSPDLFLDPSKRYTLLDPEQCAAAKFYCESGSEPFFDDCGCGCQIVETCGSAICGAGEFCCNESCGVCTPEGGFCTQQLCVSEER